MEPNRGGASARDDRTGSEFWMAFLALVHVTAVMPFLVPVRCRYAFFWTGGRECVARLFLACWLSLFGLQATDVLVLLAGDDA